MKRFLKTLSVLLILALILPLGGCANMRMVKRDISWQLDGAIVDIEGNVKEKICIGMEDTVSMDPQREIMTHFEWFPD